MNSVTFGVFFWLLSLLPAPPNVLTSNVVLSCPRGVKALGDMGTCGVHQRLASQTVFTAALSQELLAVFRTVEASSQHGSQCKYTVKGPHLRRAFCLFKRPCSWLWATGDPSHRSDTKFLFLKPTVRLFGVPPPPPPMFYRVMKTSSSSKTKLICALKMILSSSLVFLC